MTNEKGDWGVMYFKDYDRYVKSYDDYNRRGYPPVGKNYIKLYNYSVF